MATILIVDDHPLERQMLSSLLSHASHRLVEFTDGATALEMIHTEHPDLIIADILMPTMDGAELVHRIHTEHKNHQIPVIFYAPAHLRAEAEAMAISCGVQHVLTKSADPETILKTINTALDLPTPGVLPYLSEEFQRQHLQLVASKLSQKLDAVGSRLAALIETSQQLARESDPRPMLEKFCAAARDIIGAKYAVVSVLEDDGKTLKYFITSGLSAEHAARIGSPPRRHGLLGTFNTRGHPVRVADISADPHTAGFPPHHPVMRSLLGAAIASPTQFYGWLYLGDKLGVQEFSEEDEELITALAVQAAVSYENTKRHAELQREVTERKQTQDELSALYNATSYLFKAESMASLSNQIVEAVVKEFKYADCGLLLLDKNDNQMIRLARTGAYAVEPTATLHLDGPGLIPEAARTGTVIYTPDVAADARYLAGSLQTRSELVVPLKGSKGVVGVLDLQSAIEDAFSQRDQRILTAFAERAAAAIESMQLYEELNRHAADLEVRVAERTRELQEANEVLQRLDRLKTQFVADVSHELRNPITVLNMKIYLLKRSTGVDFIESLKDLEKNIKYLTDFVESVLDLSRLELEEDESGFGPTDLNAIVETVSQVHLEVAQQHGLKLEVELDPTLKAVWGKHSQLMQVVTNLVSNAIKYTPEGWVQIRTYPAAEAEGACVSVEDSGMGVMDEDLAHLFERLYRGKQAGKRHIPGLGLGLAIVDEIVRNHHGKIEVKSKVGSGSAFTVCLPYFDDVLHAESIDEC